MKSFTITRTERGHFLTACYFFFGREEGEGEGCGDGGALEGGRWGGGALGGGDALEGCRWEVVR